MALHIVLCKALWWALRVVGVPEWIVVVVQAMCNVANSKVGVNGSNSDEFEVKILRNLVLRFGKLYQYIQKS